MDEKNENITNVSIYFLSKIQVIYIHNLVHPVGFEPTAS